MAGGEGGGYGTGEGGRGYGNEGMTPRRRRTTTTRRRRARGGGGGTGGAQGWCGAVRRGGGGDGSTSRPASSCRVRTSHLVRPPVAPHEENMVVIVSFGDG
jgi:hypothetical protein